MRSFQLAKAVEAAEGHDHQYRIGWHEARHPDDPDLVPRARLCMGSRKS